MAKKTTKTVTITSKLRVDTLIHEEATRKNIPTAEYQSIMQNAEKTPIQVAYDRRNKDLDPQLVWRGKDEQDWTNLVVSAPPLYIQEKVHPKVIIDDLIKRKSKGEEPEQIDLFSDFNGLPSEGAKTEFYRHDAHWTNRMILGDSLQVMASLAEREGLRGKVQCIYFDPPYGIKFNSNFQWSTTTRDVKDGNQQHITREPEQVKAFRDTWRDGIHSYLTYLRDRLTVSRDLLSNSGSIFIQISDENIHRVRVLMDEVFGENNFVNTIVVKKKSSTLITESVFDYLLWYCKDHEHVKIRTLFDPKDHFSEKSRFNTVIDANGQRQKFNENLHFEDIKSGKLTLANDDYPLVSQHPHEIRSKPIVFQDKEKKPGPNRQWTFDPASQMSRLIKAERVRATENTLRGIVLQSDTSIDPRNNIWNFHGEPNPVYVVQTNKGIVERCILMTTDPGDLVLDPTCGSGTTAVVSEQWGRRWITMDTSRVALTLARSRVMGSKFPYYILADSREGILKKAELSGLPPSTQQYFNKVRHGFVYETVPHITLKSIANNAQIDVIYEKWESKLKPLEASLNSKLKAKFKDWEIPLTTDPSWSAEVKKIHAEWLKTRAERKREIEQSISRNADSETLYDRPYSDKQRVRVAGPFTVESVSPHKSLAINENIETKDKATSESEIGSKDFVSTILESLKTAGVQQAHKEDKIIFSEITPWPGQMISAEGKYVEIKTKKEKRAAILIGPEFGTVSRVDLVEAAKEAAESDFEVLIACAFNFDARATEFSSLGKIPVLKARMNADLHMSEDLKSTGKGNLFVVFGEPDIEIKETKDTLKVKINGVDVFHPNTGEVRSDGAEGIACWMIDTDYNEESFFVRHAYFLGANDPYKALRTSLKAEIEESAWESLNSDVSRPFNKPESGRIAVKVINHLGDEVMKVFKV